jgi:DNA-binding MarR family transcriptional regulator
MHYIFGDVMNIEEIKSMIFGGIFFVSNKLELIIDRYLSDSGITTKQWMMMVVIDKAPGKTLILSAAAKEIGSSHQNAKQIALNLEKNGFLKISKDTKDKRTLNLSLTQKSIDFWEARNKKDKDYISELLSDFSEKELEVFYESLFKLYGKIQEKENK